MEPRVLYEDRQILVVKKPAGMDSQSGRGFSLDLNSWLLKYLARVNPGRPPYLGIVHRLDRPVSGVMVFGKTKEAAASLSRQVQNHELKKTYYALLCGMPEKGRAGVLVHELAVDRRTNTSFVCAKGTPGARRAELSYEIVPQDSFEGFDFEYPSEKLYLARVELKTGRHHQIRVQFAAEGAPLWGDTKYHPDFQNAGYGQPLGLCAWRLSLVHPETGRRMEFSL